MNLKLSTKLISAFISIAVVLMVVGFIGVNGISGIQRETQHIIEAAPLIDAAMEMKLSVATDLQMIMELLAPEDQKGLDEAWKTHQNNVKTYDLYTDAILYGAETDEGKIYATKDESLKNVVEEADEFHKNEFQPNIQIIYDMMTKSFSTGKLDQKTLNEADAKADAVGAKVLNMLGEIEERTKKVMNTSTTQSNAISSRSKIMSIIGIVVGFILAVGLGVFTTRSITKPINAVCQQLADASSQVSAASGQVASASQQLAEASNQQASSIEETSASLEELTGMVNNNVSNAEKSNKISEKVNTVSAGANESMNELIKSMDEILKSNEKIQDLVKVIGEIGEKTAVIDEIVFQTKLLSFNASVEAERAGEHGRGFAVVAQEVGNLAQMSGKAATEISSIVKESIKNAEAITTENKKKVEFGNNLVIDSAKSLKEVADNAGTVTISCNQILNASKDQSDGITQINNAMAQLDKATQENASTAEEAASSSEELSAQAETLNQIVENLSFIVNGAHENGITANSEYENFSKVKPLRRLKTKSTKRSKLRTPLSAVPNQRKKWANENYQPEDLDFALADGNGKGNGDSEHINESEWERL